MYAVIETGGKQYRVEVGTELEVELLDAEPGKTITLDRVLLVADGDDASIGRPVVDGAAVSAEVVRQARGEKLIVFKYRPEGPPPGQEGPPPGADGPPHHRHHPERQERGEGGRQGRVGRQDRAPAPRGGRRRPRPPRTPSWRRSSRREAKAPAKKTEPKPKTTAKADGRRPKPRPAAEGRDARPRRRRRRKTEAKADAEGIDREEDRRPGRRPPTPYVGGEAGAEEDRGQAAPTKKDE